MVRFLLCFVVVVIAVAANALLPAMFALVVVVLACAVAVRASHHFLLEAIAKQESRAIFSIENNSETAISTQN